MKHKCRRCDKIIDERATTCNECYWKQWDVEFKDYKDTQIKKRATRSGEVSVETGTPAEGSVKVSAYSTPDRN